MKLSKYIAKPRWNRRGIDKNTKREYDREIKDEDLKKKIWDETYENVITQLNHPLLTNIGKRF